MSVRDREREIETVTESREIETLLYDGQWVVGEVLRVWAVGEGDSELRGLRE
jgi:hypothetical protein